MTFENLLYSITDRVATITLNRPDALNATTDGLYQELQGLIREIAADKDVGAVVLTGAGRGFCAGADLKVRREGMTELERRARHRWILRDILEPLVRLEKPVICAVNGVAAGAGSSIALACDFIIASDKASFVQSFARVGLVPDLGGLFMLTRAVGLPMAKELCFSARKVAAAEALSLGLVNKVVPHDDLMAEAQSMAAGIAKGSPTALGMIKSLLNKSSEVTLDQMLEYEAYAQTVAYITPEYHEGVAAFREKREPDFAAAAARG
jgi:2-(1,2-epoxy-1,2-dihydrophenyl)acetyl-CoA isomerase